MTVLDHDPTPPFEVVRSEELALRDAVDAALRGDIEHAGSVTALMRAARTLGLL